MTEHCLPPQSESSGPSPEPTRKALSTAAETFLSSLVYGLSLPERLTRSAVGLTAGTAKELAEFVVPQAFQDSKSYEVMIRNSLGFLLSGIGTVSDGRPAAKVETDSAGSTTNGGDAAANPGKFVARKAVGNFIDLAGLATLHVSPLWVLAIVSDAAYGTKTYVRELAEELQKQGLIDDSSTIHRVDDLFEAVRHASGKAASTFDQPPLSLDELRTSIEQTRRALGDVDPRSLIPESEISRLWTGMRDLAQREDVSLLGVSGAVAMQTLESIRNVSQGSMTGLFVAGKIVNRNIFGHYVRSLNTIRETGLWASVKDTYEPYFEMAWDNFAASRKTWTEQVLNPGHLRRAWSTVRRWFSGTTTPPAPSDLPIGNTPQQ